MLEKRMLIDLLKYFENDEFIITHIMGYKLIKNNKVNIIAVITNKQLIIYGKLTNDIYLNKINYNEINEVCAWNSKGLISLCVNLENTKEVIVNNDETTVSEFISRLEEITNYAKTYGVLEFDTIIDNFDYIEENTGSTNSIPYNSNNRAINTDPRSNIGVTHNHYHYNDNPKSIPNNVTINQPKQPYKKKKPLSIIAPIVVAFWLIGFLGNLAGNAPTSNTQSSTNNSDKPVIQTENKADWKTYVEEHLEIKNINCNYKKDIIYGKMPGLTLEIKNNGNRVISKLVLTAYLQDANGKDIYEDDWWIINADGFMDDFGALKPNYSWKNDKGTFHSFDNVPTEWKEGAIRIEVKKLEFE